MKVLLIRPKPSKETIGLQHVMICEPLELEYLVSNIPSSISARVECIIYDFIIEKKSFSEVIKNEKPDFIAFTGYITHVNTIKNMAKQAKEISPDVITAVGGVHAEVVGDDFIDASIDFIYRKNGVEGFNLTLEGLLNQSSKAEIENSILSAEKKEFSFELKHPARNAVEKYRNQYYYMFHNPCALIKTSYGCPFNCNFCFCKQITKGKYFARDINDVVDEISQIHEDEIYIVDDDFLFDQARLKQFIEKLNEKKIKKRYLVYGRADFIAENYELMKSLKEIGLRAVIVGVESARKKDLESYTTFN